MKKLLILLCLTVLAFSVNAQHKHDEQTKEMSKLGGITVQQMENINTLHGHACAGVAIGIRVAKVALREMGENTGDNELVAMVETDKCPVDAVQMLVGTTAGKQNLIYEKKGKNVFSFVRRKDGKGIKITVKDTGKDEKFEELRQKKFAKTATKEELQKFDAMMYERIKKVLNMPENELLTIEPFSVDVAKVQRQ